MAKKYYGKIAKQGVMWSVARTGAIDLINIPLAMVLARLLTPYHFGVMAAALFFTEFGERVTTLGFNAALVRMKQIRPEHVSTLFVITAVVDLLTWAVITVGAPWMAASLDLPEARLLLQVAALKFLIGIFGTVPVALLSRELKFRERAIADSTMTVVNAIAAISFAAAGFGYWSLILATLIKVIVRNAILIYYSGWRPSLRFSRTAAREMFSFGMGFYTKGILAYSTANIDNMVVLKLLGPVALGFYDKAFNVSARMISRILIAGPGVAFRIFALIHDEDARFRRAYRKLVMSLTLTAMPALVTIVVAAPQLIEVLFGSKWQPSTIPLQILCAGTLLTMVNSFAGSALEAKGWIWRQVARQILLVVVLVIAVAIGARSGGLVGAALGVIGARIINWFVIHQLLFAATSLRWRDIYAPQVPGVCAAALVAAVVIPLQLGWGPRLHPIVMLLVFAAAAGATYGLFLWLHRFKEARELVDEVLADVAPAWLQRWLAPRFGAAVTPTRHEA